MKFVINEVKGKTLTYAKIEALDKESLSAGLEKYISDYRYAGYHTEVRDQGGKFTKTEPGFYYLRRYSSCD